MQQVEQGCEALATMSPGPQLAAALAGIDLHQVLDGAAVQVLVASARQLAHQQAQFFTALVQVQRATVEQARCEAAARSTATRADPWAARSAAEWVGAEISAALVWSRGKADRELCLAETLVEQLPLVFAELAAGRIDQGRAWTFADVLGCAELTDDQLRQICAAVVPIAAGLTSAQIRARLLRLILAVDPDYARRRYKKAVRERGVYGYLGRDGTATITGSGLGVDEAVAACERIERLAEEVKRAGHPASVIQVRADIYVRLLDGRLDAMTTEQMIATLLADPTTLPDPDHTTAGAAARADHTAPSDTADPTERAGGQPDPCADDTTDAAVDARGDAGPEAGKPDRAQIADGRSAAPAPAGSVSAAGPADSAEPGPAPSTSPPPSPRRGGEVRVGLGTLMHLDDHPADLPGWGPAIAEVARAMVGRQHRAEWRFAVTDLDGYLILAGVTRRRPRGAGAAASECRGGVVEIHVPAEQLAQWAAERAACGEWAPIVADIARQYADRDRHQRLLDGRPHDRFAHALLRRHVQIRDRTCVAPGCRRAARRCQLDHTVEYDLGGFTTAANSGPLCLGDHLRKHHGGWLLEQPRPGHFRWTSPLGRTYHTRGEPISPPGVEPAPRADPHDTGPDGPRGASTDPGPIFCRPPPEPAPPLPPPATPDDDPPF